jgi:hypothetical protein
MRDVNHWVYARAKHRLAAQTGEWHWDVSYKLPVRKPNCSFVRHRLGNPTKLTASRNDRRLQLLS